MWVLENNIIGKNSIKLNRSFQKGVVPYMNLSNETCNLESPKSHEASKDYFVRWIIKFRFYKRY